MSRLLKEATLHLIFVASCVLLFFVIDGLVCSAAPHLPRRRYSSRRPQKAKDLQGKWMAKWAGVNCVVLLRENGSYAEKYCTNDRGEGGSKYWGTWGLDREGNLWIHEVPANSYTGEFTTYLFKWDPENLKGPRIDHDSEKHDTFEFKLIRRLSSQPDEPGRPW